MNIHAALTIGALINTVLMGRSGVATISVADKIAKVITTIPMGKLTFKSDKSPEMAGTKWRRFFGALI
jgi:hypothetical protein